MTPLLGEIAAYPDFWTIAREYDPAEVETLEQAWALPSPPSRSYRAINVIEAANIIDRYRRQGWL